MANYPIWIDVDACVYKSSKSYGARDNNVERVLVGTSSSSSELFCTRKVTRRTLDDGNISFRAFHNDICIEEMIYNPKKHVIVSRKKAKIQGI